jgi:hypothetical protein
VTAALFFLLHFTRSIRCIRGFQDVATVDVTIACMEGSMVPTVISVVAALDALVVWGCHHLPHTPIQTDGSHIAHGLGPLESTLTIAGNGFAGLFFHGFLKTLNSATFVSIIQLQTYKASLCSRLFQKIPS